MEATHLGAYFSERMDEDLEKAFEILEECPKYQNCIHKWLAVAMKVKEAFPLMNRNKVTRLVFCVLEQLN